MKTLLAAMTALIFVSISPAGAVTYCRSMGNGVNVRENHNTHSRILYSLRLGNRVRKVDDWNNWARIHRVNGTRRGWASKTYLRCWYSE